ncbi:hypothetical protein [Mycobacterium sp.]|uniref:hypothetical protein n=1 Tax=Mycobacterium sp. TaxID=1785 RepID=UPI003C795FD3
MTVSVVAGQGCGAVPASFAEAGDVRTGCGVNVVAGQGDQFTDPQSRLNSQGQQRLVAAAGPSWQYRPDAAPHLPSSSSPSARPSRCWRRRTPAPAGLLGGATYTMNQASYDLARLRINGLITRVPGRNRYRLTDDGLRFAIFYTKLHDRLLRTLLAADRPPAPPALRKALHTIDIHITETIDQARLLPNAA